MKVACLCPTYGRPRLLANALAQFQAQTHPAEDRRLFILEDAGQIGPGMRSPFGEHLGIRFFPGEHSGSPDWAERLGSGPNINEPDFEVWSFFHRFPSLPAIYALLVERALKWGAEAFCVWDDDDIYLSDHVANHVKVLRAHGWSHPKTVYSLYTGRVEEEGAAGRFHGALAFRRDYGERVGYWGEPANGRCDMDQAILGRLHRISPPGQSVRRPSYVYRWGSTGCSHASGRASGPGDAHWFFTTPIDQPGRVERLEAKFDDETARVYQLLSSKR